MLCVGRVGKRNAGPFSAESRVTCHRGCGPYGAPFAAPVTPYCRMTRNGGRPSDGILARRPIAATGSEGDS